jgi:hypothetical protein
MAKSRSESPLREAEIPRLTSEQAPQSQRVRQGEETVPGPGKGYLTLFPRP